jgi:hypothetical protein
MLDKRENKMHVLDKGTLREQLVTAKHKLEQAEFELSKFQWIDINEQKPEYGQFANVCGGEVGGVSSGFYDPDYGECTFECVDDDEMSFLEVKYWMPLPQPPKE